MKPYIVAFTRVLFHLKANQDSTVAHGNPGRGDHFDVLVEGLICTDVEFERWAQLTAGQDQFSWESRFYRPDTTSTWLGCRVSEPAHLSVVFINWSEETAEIGVSVSIMAS